MFLLPHRGDAQYPRYLSFTGLSTRLPVKVHHETIFVAICSLTHDCCRGRTGISLDLNHVPTLLPLKLVV
jgi:hypothetical protein